MIHCLLHVEEQRHKARLHPLTVVGRQGMEKRRPLWEEVRQDRAKQVLSWPEVDQRSDLHLVVAVAAARQAADQNSTLEDAACTPAAAEGDREDTAVDAAVAEDTQPHEGHPDRNTDTC